MGNKKFKISQWNQQSIRKLIMKSVFPKVAILLAILTLTACGGGSSEESEGVVTPPVNQPPTANAGTDQSVDENTVVTLTGTGSDLDGTITAYNWVQTSGTTVTLTGADTNSATFTAPLVTQDETLTFELVVTDDNDSTNSDSVTISVELAQWKVDIENRWLIPIEQLNNTCFIENVICNWDTTTEEFDITLNGKGYSTDAHSSLTFSVSQERLDYMNLEPSSSYSYKDIEDIEFSLGEGNFSSWYECLNDSCTIENRKNTLLDATPTEDGFISKGEFIDTRSDYSDRLTMDGIFRLSYFINGPNYYVDGEYVGSMHSRFFNDAFYQEVYNAFKYVYGYASDDPVHLDGPTVSDISVSPDEINVTNDNQEVIATVSVSDPSGIDLAALPNPYWYQVDDVQGTRIDSVWELTSGDEFNATFTSTVIIPMGAKGGTWRVGSTAFRDNLGYRSTNGGHETTFTVTSN